jgi:hypothetical protein
VGRGEPACTAEAAGGRGRRRRIRTRCAQPLQPLRRGGHCVSSGTDRYFTKQKRRLGSCPEHSPKGVCSGYFLPKGIKFHLIALSSEHSPKGVCSGYFLPKGIKFHLIALSTRQKAFARILFAKRSKFSVLFLNKS